MCGITGFIDFTNRSYEVELVKMADSLIHRGPDASGYDFVQTEHYQLGLGHRRLSILDLTENGRQPMYSSDDQCAMVFNGEVYNFVEIRKWLVSKGYSFKSNSDSEVILYALKEEGPKAVHRFIGMFAIVFFDKSKDELLLIRDRVGVKPLFFTWNNQTLLFASETRAFHHHHSFDKTLNNQSIADYLDFDYIKGGQSIFKSVDSVKPGSYLKLDVKTRVIKEEKYWAIEDYYNRKSSALSFDQAVEALDNLLVDACKLRMVSDVPVGVFLSGGLDSTTVAAILQKHHSSTISTFTIGFTEEEFNEANKAKKIANFLGTDHHELYCSESQLLDIFPRLPEIYDEPFADKSAIPTTLVSEFAKRYVTVALSADGGDEIFAGYNKYADTLAAFDRISGQSQMGIKNRRTLLKLIGQLGLAIGGTQSKLALKSFSSLKYLAQYPDIVKMMISASKNFGERDLNLILKGFSPVSRDLNHILNKDRLSQIQAYDYNDYLPDDILVKLDRAAMSVSLEGREPLLDHRIAEFAATLTSDFKIKKGKRKYILSAVNARYLPKELIEGPKKGFAIPKKRWMETHLRDYVSNYLSDTMTKDVGVFSPQYISGLLKQYEKGVTSNRVWNVLLFHMWYERWMK